MKNKIRDEFRQSEFEAKSLADYKAELEQLVQEKMAHVEELRLIHADINMMESIIKQVWLITYDGYILAHICASYNLI